MIVVFGSINLDLVFSLPALPQPGETVLGASCRLAPGGKGANQATAAARDGAHTIMIGRVGGDTLAGLALGGLEEAGVDVSGVMRSAAATGCAAVCVDPAGRNQIAVAQGANAEAAAVQVADRLLGSRTTLVVQMEAPAAETAILIGRAHARGSRIILNLAPASRLDDAALKSVEIVVVNEIEAAWLAAAHGIAAGMPDTLVRRLAAALGNTVVLTLGAEGAIAVGRGEAWAVGALPVRPVDTTGAGDAFVGVMAAALDRGTGMAIALHRASVAAGLACLEYGAQPSYPLYAATDARLADLAPARHLPS
ncbi:MAG: ribokinase [Rhodospirillales bacterium]|nr:ribokinase [Rhodospirillales bacterium]